MKRVVLLLFIPLAVTQATGIIRNEKGDEICLTKSCITNAAYILNNMNESMDPCENFYNFACGGFEEQTTIPESKTGRELYEVIFETLYSQLKRLVDEPVRDSEPLYSKNIKAFYQSCMDRDRIEEKSVPDVKAIFQLLGGWPMLDGDAWNETAFDWTKFVYTARELGLNDAIFIHLNVATDLKNSSWRVIHFDQPSMIMKRVSYFKGLENPMIKAYHKFQIDFGMLLGADRFRVEKETWEVFEFEKKLATISAPDEDRRDFSQNYHEFTLKEMEDKWEGIPFLEYARKILPSTVNVTENTRVICEAPKYLDQLPLLLQFTPKRTVANYMIWRIIFSVALFMNDDVRRIQTDYKRIAFGVTERIPRWEECVSLTLSLQVAAGAIYVRNFFNEASKGEALEMANNIKQAFFELMDENTWMDNVTRGRAKEKLSAMLVLIAYPQELLNDTAIEEYYTDLGELGEDFLVNSLRVTKFGLDYFLGQLETAVDRAHWIDHANAAEVNAFHIFPRNLIEFPAGVLQGAFFQVERPRYMNYAAIGMVIGHELSHGFDDRGALFDKNGMITNWWDAETKEAYDKKLECIIRQYGNYSVGDGHYFNGRITQGEASADNAGMKQAYLAYQNWAKRNKPEPRLPGLEKYNQNQLFWLSGATIWCSKYRPLFIRSAVATKEHPTGEFRIVGVVSNSKSFAEDFNCPLGAPMNPVNKCIVW